MVSDGDDNDNGDDDGDNYATDHDYNNTDDEAMVATALLMVTMKAVTVMAKR